MSNKLLDVVIAILLTAAILLLAWVVGWIVDQTFTQGEPLSSAEIVGKQHYLATRRLIPLGRLISISTTPERWNLLFLIDGEIMSGSVDEACYAKTEVGDRMDVIVKRGIFSLGVYPICE